MDILRLIGLWIRSNQPWARKPIELPSYVEEWPSLVEGDHYLSVTGEEVYLRNGYWGMKDGSRFHLTPPPRQWKF